MRFQDILMLASQQGSGAAAGGAETPTFVAHAVERYAGANSGATTAGINTTTADFIVIAVTGYGASSWTVTDSQSNTWTAGTKYDATAQNPSVQLYYCTNPTTNASHTFTLSGSAVYGRINAAAFSGVAATSPLETANSGTATVASGSISSGSVTPSLNNSLLIAAGGFGSATGPGFNGTPAFTALDESTGLGGSDYSTGFAYYVQATAASISSGWAWGAGSGDTVASITAFKPGP